MKQQGVPLATFPIAVVLVASIALYSVSAKAETEDDKPNFVDRVGSIGEFGKIEFERRGHYRLWGVLPEPQALREQILGSTLACLESGRSRAGDRYAEVVYCWLYSTELEREGYRNGVNITRYLIENDLGTEICTETHNKYQSC